MTDEMNSSFGQKARLAQQLLDDVARAFSLYCIGIAKTEAEAKEKMQATVEAKAAKENKEAKLKPYLRRPDSCREAVRAVLRAEPGLLTREVIKRLPRRKAATVRANLAVLVRTKEADLRDGKFYYVSYDGVRHAEG